MELNALIVGYGRAGKRHARILSAIGDITWFPVEPDITQIDKDSMFFATLEEALKSSIDWDFAVICTPPELHLKQIKQCLDSGLKVLCEKPLCGLGQLAEARTIPQDAPVMVAYNYRYHPELRKVQGKSDVLFMSCRQNREVPYWGLLLDHLSHDFDILRFLAGPVEVIQSRHLVIDHFDSWEVVLRVGDKEAGLHDWISQAGGRIARIYFEDDTEISIDPNPIMFTEMYKAFLSGNYYPDLKEAIMTQELIERCQELANK